MSFKLQIAVIGCGHWGKSHVRNFSEFGVLKYEKALRLQEAYKNFPRAGELTVSEECSGKVFTLHMTKFLEVNAINDIISGAI